MHHQRSQISKHVGCCWHLFLKEDCDIVKLGKDVADPGCLCHRQCQVGTPITDEEISLVNLSQAGMSEPFQGAVFDDSSPASIAERMIRVTKCACRITCDPEGFWVGDCENCHKHLGHNCLGIEWVQSKHHQSMSLEQLRKHATNIKSKDLLCQTDAE